MTSLKIEWKHFDKNGATCQRCSQTGQNLTEVVKELVKTGLKVDYQETKLTKDYMDQSNQILINGTLIENLLPDTKASQNHCDSCTDLIASPQACNCRTLTQGQSTYEQIPKSMIKTAVLTALNNPKIINSPNQSMKIQVLGSGCPTCKTLYELTQTAVKDLGIEAEVEYSTDISKIIEMGVMQSPVLALNGKPLMVGSGNLEKIKEVLTKGVSVVGKEVKSDCTCGGKCC